MKRSFNLDNVTKVEFNGYHESTRFKWFDNPRGTWFKKPSGVYFIDDYGDPITQHGLISDNFEDTKRIFEAEERYIVVNPEHIRIYVKSNVKIWFVNAEDPEIIYFDSDSEAEEFYNSIVGKMKNVQGI